MYLFSAQLMQPVYYRLINGNITDIRSMALCVKELKVDNVIFIADKGFYSEENIKMLDAERLQYIIPLRRSHALIDFSPLGKANWKKEVKNYFSYQDRSIWYYQYERNGKRLITFLDERLRVTEENDYLQRITGKSKKYTQERFFEKLLAFGTLTVMCHINHQPQAGDVYQTYKQRNEIEVMFDSYKNYLAADVTYMQDRYVLEGWLLANFMAMMAYYKLFTRLKNAELLKKYSPKDIIEFSKAIHMLKIKGKWHQAETTEKTRKHFKQIKIDYLK
jgi:transposase